MQTKEWFIGRHFGIRCMTTASMRNKATVVVWPSSISWTPNFRKSLPYRHSTIVFLETRCFAVLFKWLNFLVLCGISSDHFQQRNVVSNSIPGEYCNSLSSQHKILSKTTYVTSYITITGLSSAQLRVRYLSIIEWCLWSFRNSLSVNQHYVAVLWKENSR